jgi:putative transposase
VKRGLYRSATGIEFNADVNGAIGIARKVAEQYGFQFNARSFALGRFDNA